VQLEDFIRTYEDYTQDFEVFSNLHHCDNWTYLYRGFCKMQLGNYAIAIEDFNKAICLKLQHQDVYLYRGCFWQTKNLANGT
jgi:tetratricopeptide (TPR) repeat protein